MKKLFATPIYCAVMLMLGSVMLMPRATFAEDHVVQQSQIQKDLATASATRQQNEQQLKSFLATPDAQKAIESAHMNYQQVTGAVSQLNDSDLARLAARSSKAQNDFAAGLLGAHGIAAVIVLIAIIIILVAIFH